MDLDRIICLDNIPNIFSCIIICKYRSADATVEVRLEELENLESNVLTLSIVSNCHISTIVSALLADSFTNKSLKISSKSRIQEMVMASLDEKKIVLTINKFSRCRFTIALSN